MDNLVNPQTENGHLDLANELVEVMAKTRLSNYETRIIFAVWRKTYCWHKKEDWISFSQFRELTGMHDSHISRSIKYLIARNILTKRGKFLEFNKDYSSWVNLPKGVTTHNTKDLPKGVSPLTKRGKKNLPKGADTKEKPKETITKETLLDSNGAVPALSVVEKPDKRNKDLQEIIDFSIKNNFSLQGSSLQNRRYAYNLMKKKDSKGETLGVTRIKWLIQGAIKSKGQPFTPQISDFKSLYYKWQDLISFLQKQKQSNKPKGVKI